MAASEKGSVIGGRNIRPGSGTKARRAATQNPKRRATPKAQAQGKQVAVARIRKKLNKKHSDTSEPGETPRTDLEYGRVTPPTKRAPKGQSKVLQCGCCDASAKKDGTGWAFLDDGGAPMGNACKRCFLGWSSSGAADLAWDAHCDKCQCDPEYRDKSELACCIVAGELMSPWPQAAVTADDAFVLRTTRSFIGIARSDFTDLAGGAGLSSMGITEIDMPDEFGNMFKGVLMHDPAQPFVRYTLENTQAVKKSKFSLQPGHDCTPALAGFRYQEARAQRDREPFITKLRNTLLTAQTVDDLIGQPTFVPAVLGSVAGGDAAAGSSSGQPLTEAQQLIQSGSAALMASPAKRSIDDGDEVRSALGRVALVAAGAASARSPAGSGLLRAKSSASLGSPGKGFVDGDGDVAQAKHKVRFVY